MVELVIWNHEVAGSNPAFPRLLISTPPRGKSWVTLRCYINLNKVVLAYIACTDVYVEYETLKMVGVKIRG